MLHKLFMILVIALFAMVACEDEPEGEPCDPDTEYWKCDEDTGILWGCNIQSGVWEENTDCEQGYICCWLPSVWEPNKMELHACILPEDCPAWQ